MSLRRAVGVCSGPSTSGPTRPATATRLCVGCWCLKRSPPGPHPEGGRVAGDRGNTVMSKARRYPTCSDRSNTHRAILPLGRGVAPPLPPSGRAAPTTDRVMVTSPRDVDIVLKSDCSGLANRSGTGDSDGESAPAPGLSVPHREPDRRGRLDHPGGEFTACRQSSGPRDRLTWRRLKTVSCVRGNPARLPQRLQWPVSSMTPEHRRRCWSHNVASAQGNQCGTGRDAVGRLFAAALDGDRRAEAALHLLGGFDDTAHRASFALLDAVDAISATPPGPVPPDVLASIDRIVAALRDHQRSMP